MLIRKCDEEFMSYSLLKTRRRRRIFRRFPRKSTLVRITAQRAPSGFLKNLTREYTGDPTYSPVCTTWRTAVVSETGCSLDPESEVIKIPNPPAQYPPDCPSTPGYIHYQPNVTPYPCLPTRTQADRPLLAFLVFSLIVYSPFLLLKMTRASSFATLLIISWFFLG